MGTLYMVFHWLQQFWPGSAKAVPLTTGVTTNAAARPAVARSVFTVGGSFWPPAQAG